MSVCEFNIIDDSGQTHEENLLNIQNELVWGLTYRDYKQNEKNKPMLPMHSPIHIPFELCRADKLLLGSKTKLAYETNAIKTEPRHEPGKKGDGKSSERQTAGKSKRSKKKRNTRVGKPSLLERNVMSQNKYMDFLSIPNQKWSHKPRQKKCKKICEIEPCPPRFIQLAVPSKRKVFANWKEYADFLPTEMLMRYEDILHTDQNLEPREARYYYKKLDRKKRQKIKKKHRQEKLKKLENELNTNWQKAQIDLLANVIVEYIKDEPLFALNYKQMLLSDGILDRLEKTKQIKKPSRRTKNHYKKTVIDVSDKLAIWIDTLTRFVDVQAIESDADIPPVSISTLSFEGEDEGESDDYESSSDDEFHDDQLFEQMDENMWGEDLSRGDAKPKHQDGEEAAEGLIEDLFRPGEGEDAGDLEDMLNDLDADVLEKLINILSNCSEDFLDGEIDVDQMPGVKYIDVLNRLKALRDSLSAQDGQKSFLEQIMIDWAIRNDADNVSDDILHKIHDVAGLLGELLTQTKPSDGAWDVIGHTSDEEGEEATGGDVSDIPEADESDAVGVSEVEEDGKVLGADEAETDISEGEGDVSEGVFEGEGGTGVGAEGEVQEEGKQSQDTLLDRMDISGISGEEGVISSGISQLEGEDGIELPLEYEAAGVVPVEEGEGEEEEVAILYEPPSPLPTEEVDIQRPDGRVIKGHKPSKVFEHAADTVCCLSLKTWAVWLLEVTHNAHNWTQWMSCVIQKVREYAAIVRGDVLDAKGQVQVLPKAEWRKFIAETEESVVAWRQYSAHVKDLSQSIVENFHGKKINCCPKCLQDHLITNVVVAHETLQAITEAISCAAYWQRCLDNMVDKTCSLSETTKDDTPLEVLNDDDSDEDVDLEEVLEQVDDSLNDSDDDSIYEIEGLKTS